MASFKRKTTDYGDEQVYAKKPRAKNRGQRNRGHRSLTIRKSSKRPNTSKSPHGPNHYPPSQDFPRNFAKRPSSNSTKKMFPMLLPNQFHFGTQWQLNIRRSLVCYGLILIVWGLFCLECRWRCYWFRGCLRRMSCLCMTRFWMIFVRTRQGFLRERIKRLVRLMESWNRDVVMSLLGKRDAPFHLSLEKCSMSILISNRVPTLMKEMRFYSPKEMERTGTHFQLTGRRENI